MRILHIIHKPEMGGIQKFVANLIPPINERNNDYYLISSQSQNGDLIDEFRRKGFKYRFFVKNLKPFRPSRIYLAINRIALIYKLTRLILFIFLNRIDIVHSHLMVASDVALQLKSCCFLRVPMIWTLHGIVPEEQNTKNLQIAIDYAIDKSLPFAVTYVGKRQNILDKLNFKDDVPIKAVPIGIPLENYQVNKDSRKKNRSDFNLKYNDLVIGCTARLSKEKGIDILLDSTPMILEQIPNARFLIAGEGKEREELGNQCYSLEKSDAITFLGQIQDVRTFLSLLDVYVQPSRDEGIPLGIIEAMAAGLPVIATNVGGIPLAVHNEQTGLLIDAEDSHALSLAVIELALNKKKRFTFGNNGKKNSKNFDIQLIRSYYENLYISLKDQLR